MNHSNPHIIIIGAGFTGCAIAHDLALRGFAVSVYERGEIASGTSGRTHGLLHSGARYCVTDQEAAVECIEENIILRKIAKPCIEFNGGLFAAFNDSDLEYAPLFINGAQECGIPIEELNREHVLALEPNLNPEVKLAYTVPDGSFDPLRLAFAFAATAKSNGAAFFPYHEVEGFLYSNGKISGIRVWDRRSNQKMESHADLVINATGAWAGNLARLAEIDVQVIPTPGIMVAYDQRLVNRVINRLNEPDDGDILIPQRRMVVIGTTSFDVEDVDYIPVVEDQIQQMQQSAVSMVPSVQNTTQRGIYMSARPLIGITVLGRSLSRTFKCFDHQVMEGVEGFITITGGKATTCRVMAEKTVDLVCQKLGYHQPCSTAEVILQSYRKYFEA